MLFWKLTLEYRDYLYPWPDDASELASVMQILARGQAIERVWSEREGDTTSFLYSDKNRHTVTVSVVEIDEEIYINHDAAMAARDLYDRGISSPETNNEAT